MLGLTVAATIGAAQTEPVERAVSLQDTANTLGLSIRPIVPFNARLNSLRSIGVAQAEPAERAAPMPGSIDALGLASAAGPVSEAASEQLPQPLPEMLLDTRVACSVDRLFRIVMAPEDAFISTQHSAHRYTDVHIGSWQTEPTGAPPPPPLWRTRLFKVVVRLEDVLISIQHIAIQDTRNVYHVTSIT